MSPPIDEVMAILGRTKVIQRLRRAVEHIGIDQGAGNL
ncbi:MAG: hypothetical protein MUO29_03820 [Desulfobacterales bacterium]|nr:hypothetical protein [Desulfobacterales bacterium]